MKTASPTFNDILMPSTNQKTPNRCRDFLQQSTTITSQQQKQLPNNDMLCGIELCVVCGDKASGNHFFLILIFLSYIHSRLI